MRKSKLNKLLNLWENNSLITHEQNLNICDFMKERRKEQFFRLIKWFFIIGAFWIVFGLIAAIIQLFDLSFMERLAELFTKIFVVFTIPIINLLKYLFGERYGLFLIGLGSLILSGLFIFLSMRSKSDSSIDSLNITTEQKNILKNPITLDVMACIFLSNAFWFFNLLLIPNDMNIHDTVRKIFPLWHLLGAATFISLAYKFNKVIYLLFGIYFISLCSGMFSGYGYACYWIGASRPIIQLLVGAILILVGYINELKLDDTDEIKEKFAQTYNWTGLLISFIALWIMSFWGFDLNYGKSILPSASELWISNILFIGASVGAMYYGGKSEHKVFFNYGLTFLIIETYTIFCSRLWDKMPFALASLIFGILLVITGKLLVKIYIKKQNKN